MRKKHVLGAVFCGVVSLGFMACGDPVADARKQYADGEAAYGTYCASCHEIDQGIGPRLKREVIATRLTGASLLSYSRRNMPYQAGNTLLPQQYLDITAYLLVREGLMDTSMTLTEVNAGSVTLTLIDPPSSE